MRALSEALGTPKDRIDPQARTITTSFQLKRRGVEAKIILGAATVQLDPILAQNLAVARKWYAAIKAGSSFGDLAKQEGTSVNRIRQIIGLAFLAPDIMEAIAAGSQPLGLTSEWIKRRSLPLTWQDQRALIADL